MQQGNEQMTADNKHFTNYLMNLNSLINIFLSFSVSSKEK